MRSVLPLLIVLLAACGGRNLATPNDSDLGDHLPTPPPPDGGPPKEHRPTAGICPLRPAGMMCPFDGVPPDMGGCRSDSDCSGGVNGRCEGVQAGCFCTYDTCQSDHDCKPNQVCACAPPLRSGSTLGNTCLDGNCHVDSDCGAYDCSPSLGPGCIPMLPLVGYFCHTASDTCTNDSDCQTTGVGYCAYHPELGHWACMHATCGG
jgi:hypothetical protein